MFTKTSRQGSWSLSTSLAAMFVFLATVAGASPERGQNELPEVFRGVLISMGNTATGANTSIDMHITGWTSPTQRRILVNALRQGTEGEVGLFNLLRNQPEKGFVQVRGVSGTTRLKYAWQEERPDGGRRITLLADRPLPGMFGRQLGDDEYLILRFEVDEDGSGSGNAAVGATIAWDQEAGRLRIGIQSTEPLRMTSVRKDQ